MRGGTPVIDANNLPYWHGLQEGRILLQACGGCGAVRFPDRAICPECWSSEFTWQEASGEATVHTFVWYFTSLDPRFTRLPYNVAVVELSEGPKLVSNVDDVAFGELAVGQALRPRFVPGPDGWTVLHFAPA